MRRASATVGDRRGDTRGRPQRRGDGEAGRRVGELGRRAERHDRLAAVRQPTAHRDGHDLLADRRRQHLITDAGAEHAAEQLELDRRARRQHRLLDEPSAGDRNDVAERRTFATARRAQVHQHDVVAGVHRRPLADDDAVGRLVGCRWRRPSEHRREPGGLDHEAGVDVARIGHDAAAPLGLADRRGVRPANVEAVLEVSPQRGVVDDAVRPLDHVAAVAVDDDVRGDVGEAGVRQVGDVVAPRRRTSPATASRAR